MEIRRRTGLPFQRRRLERIAATSRTFESRVNQDGERQQDSDAQHKRTDRRPLMEDHEFGVVRRVTSRHPAGTHHELRKECQVEIPRTPGNSRFGPANRCTSVQTSWATSETIRPTTRSAFHPPSQSESERPQSRCRAGECRSTKHPGTGRSNHQCRTGR